MMQYKGDGNIESEKKHIKFEELPELIDEMARKYSMSAKDLRASFLGYNFGRSLSHNIAVHRHRDFSALPISEIKRYLDAVKTEATLDYEKIIREVLALEQLCAISIKALRAIRIHLKNRSP